MTAQEITRTLAVVLAAGLCSELVAGLLRLPRMVVLLAAGALLGPSVLGAVDVSLANVGIELLLTLGVSFILFYGGPGPSAQVLRKLPMGRGLVAAPGVVGPVAVTGAV